MEGRRRSHHDWDDDDGSAGLLDEDFKVTHGVETRSVRCLLCSE